MNEEQLLILKMVEEKKITAEEAMGLLAALEKTQKQTKPVEPQETGETPTRTGKFFRVRVTDVETGRVRVNMRIPLSVVSTGMKMGMRFRPEVEGLDLKDLDGFIKNGVVGQIVDIIDEDDGEHVEVSIE